ncbi:glycosyltransferase [Chitiniphilus purpureus]|uniref:Glycosyltransferase n=1 Tax=Chitiniphilus purpureus TaxID=2981137 RepID=A0ABY6DMN5_9NEIS|nr:glycosyltransferase [Chitiniphilus sp. CD1]UXY15614.1 glycosyltransferase [Chitiniphilus sp. CD1]
MRVTLLSESDHSGGAARAAWRLYCALHDSGLMATMQVARALREEPGVRAIRSGQSQRLRRWAGRLINRLQVTGNQEFHSANVLPSRWHTKLNTSGIDVLNLHWVGGEALSIEDLGRLTKPIVWTLHDMWPFCGAEHYADEDETARWRHGYHAANRTLSARGLDLDRWVWIRKQRAWRQPLHLVSPSRWLAQQAKASALLGQQPVHVIPNPIDLTVFRPYPQAEARARLHLPPNQLLILFGALGGTHNPRKGADLLEAAIGQLPRLIGGRPWCSLIFGQSAPAGVASFGGQPAIWLGHIGEDKLLALLYSAADVMVVPSRQENLPQTATEAQACGCPVVAFDCTGLPDAVLQHRTGFLAKAYDAGDLAHGIRWILDEPTRRRQLGSAAAERARTLWSPVEIARQYQSVFEQALLAHASGQPERRP